MSKTLLVETPFVCFIFFMKRRPYFPMLVNIIRVVFFLATHFSPLIRQIVKNHKVVLKMSWFRASFPIISSFQGFYRAVLWWWPFLIHVSGTWAQKVHLTGQKGVCSGADPSNQVPSQAFFFCCFPTIKPMAASCRLLNWTGFTVGQ